MKDKAADKKLWLTMLSARLPARGAPAFPRTTAAFSVTIFVHRELHARNSMKLLPSVKTVTELQDIFWPRYESGRAPADIEECSEVIQVHIAV